MDEPAVFIRRVAVHDPFAGLGLVELLLEQRDHVEVDVQRTKIGCQAVSSGVQIGRQIVSSGVEGRRQTVSSCVHCLTSKVV